MRQKKYLTHHFCLKSNNWERQHSQTRQSKQCGFCTKINGQVGQGGEVGLVWSDLCQKNRQDDFDSEFIGFDGSPDNYLCLYICEKCEMSRL